MTQELTLVNRLRELLLGYTKTPAYEHLDNQDVRIYVANVQYAVSLNELAILTGRVISCEEEFYFGGSYQVSRFLCDGQFQELSNLYDQLIEQTTNQNYFRK